MGEHREFWWDFPAADLVKVVHLAPFETVLGAPIEELQVAYESWGELNEERDNAVLVVHLLTSDAHATGEFDGQPRGWWEDLIGPGRAIDTDRYFVVCPNLLGGCHGTTGPRFPAPDGEPYLDRFPLLTPLDLMRVQRLFLETLGIHRPHTVIGPSMGGMVAWEWAVEGGDAVEEVVVVAAPPVTTAYEIGLNWLQRRGVAVDLREGSASKRGRIVSRGVGMLSYRAPEGLEEKFGRTWFKEPGRTLGEPGLFNVESWLLHHGKKSVKRFDPYTYDLFSRVMDLHDLSRDRGSMDEALGRVRCRVLAIGIDSDRLYPAPEVRAAVEVLQRHGRDATYREIRSDDGHDAFLLEAGQIDRFLREWNG
jgi:homoserine O-acetyltransferase